MGFRLLFSCNTFNEFKAAAEYGVDFNWILAEQLASCEARCAQPPR